VNDERLVRSSSSERTESIGEGIAQRIRAGDVLLLEGDLAAGKTTLVRGVLRGLGGEPDDVSSPSFVLLKTYQCCVSGIDRLHHVDLYRLADRLPELREIGLEEILSEVDAVIAVEWPRDTLARWIPDDARLWRLVLSIEQDGSRSIRVEEPTGNGSSQ
jgi:tRNA threonylcarbamoyl adenosine modification protein YjeE